MSKDAELLKINQEIDKIKREKEKDLGRLRKKTEDKEQLQGYKRKNKLSRVDLQHVYELNEGIRQKNYKLRGQVDKINDKNSQLMLVNTTIKVGVEKLCGVAYGKRRVSRNKTKKLAKSKSK